MWMQNLISPPEALQTRLYHQGYVFTDRHHIYHIRTLCTLHLGSVIFFVQMAGITPLALTGLICMTCNLRHTGRSLDEGVEEVVLSLLRSRWHFFLIECHGEGRRRRKPQSTRRPIKSQVYTKHLSPTRRHRFVS